MSNPSPQVSSAPGRFLALSILALLATTLAGRAGEEMLISQRDKRFLPGTVTLAKDQSLVVVNDDGSTVHHAYVESDAFNFDSGDQLPGKRVSIAFPGSGRYTVLCGIHPKMKLDVTVK